MADFSEAEQQRRRQKPDSEVFQEVLAALQRSELLGTKPERAFKAHPGDRRPTVNTPEPPVIEGELRRVRVHLTQVQRLSHTGSFTTDLETQEHVWSDELYRILEIEPGAKVTAQTLSALVQNDDRPAFLAQFESLLANGANFDQVFRIITPKGTAKHLRAVAQVVGATRAVVMGSIQDLTESRKAEEALKVSDVELRRAHAQLSEGQRLSKTGSFTSDLQLDQHSWSEEYYHIFALDRAAPPSVEAVRNRVHPDDLSLFDAEIQRGIGGSNADFTFRIVTPDGDLKHLRGVARVIEQVAGRPIFMGTVQDITESKVSEAALMSSKAELLLANSYLTIAQRLSKTGSFTWNLRTNERRWSEEMYRIFEVEPNGPVPAARAGQVIHPDDLAIFDALVARARKGKNFDAELRVIVPSGAVKHVHVVGNLVSEAKHRPVFVGALQDVTDRKVAEEGLHRARSELAHVARATALSALTASIAHEVNQPLAGIIANASTCLRLLAVDPPNIEGAQATAERTIRDGHRASEVIVRLRALFARQPVQKEAVDLNEAAKEILVLSASELHSGNVVLHTDFAQDLPTVVGDRVQLQQVILNLVLNAAQAMQGIDGRPHDLRISTDTAGTDEVTLSVRDSGVGAAMANLDELFNAFYTTKPDGMGVGLSVSRSIVEAHNGRLWAVVNDGPGLTVSFTLPTSSASGDGGDRKTKRGGGRSRARELAGCHG
jgi:signal transduction histidine kinase